MAWRPGRRHRRRLVGSPLAGVRPGGTLVHDIRVRLGEPFRLAAADRVRPSGGPVTLWLTGVRLVTHRPESDEWVYLEGVKVMPDGSLGDHTLVLVRASLLRPR